jgi:hypothetical protein
MDRAKNKINRMFGGIITWFNNNRPKILVYSLSACIIALIGLSVYIVIDYKKYKALVEKLQKLEQFNLLEPEQQTQVENEIPVSEEEILKGKKSGKHF